MLKEITEAFQVLEKLQTSKTNTKKFNFFIKKVNGVCSKLVLDFEKLKSVGEKRSFEHILYNLQNVLIVIENKLNRSNNKKIKETASAFQNRLKTAIIINIQHFDIKEFLSDCKRVILDYVKKQVDTFKCFKISFNLYLMFKKYDTFEEKSFQTNSYLVLHHTNFQKTFEDTIDLLLTTTQEFESLGSNWIFVGIKNMIVTVVKCEYFVGASYVDLPLQIKNKQGCINIKNVGNDCFAYSIISALFPAKSNVSSKSSYPPYEKHLKFGEIKMPISINDIPQFEKMNNLKINVYSFDKDNIIYPLSFFKKKKIKQIINILYFDNNFC